MGATQSAQVMEEEEEEDEVEEEEEDDEVEEEEDENVGNEGRELGNNILVKKVLEQEPEMLPCHASASPLSPQLSSLGTPRLGPSIKVWDPYNVLAPPPFSRTFSSDAINEDRTVTDVFLISHGDWHMNLRPDLVAGRCPDAALTANGKRQARALAVSLKSQGIRFHAVYTSPLDRARATAVSVSQEMNFGEEQIQSSDALLEMSQGHWEGCHRSEVYTPEIMSLMDRFQPDFSAPSGESLRQVEFRMVQFLNGTVLGLPEKFRSDFSPPSQNESLEFTHHNSHSLVNSIHDRDGSSLPPPQWDLLHRHRQGLSRKKSGKSRLQIVTTTGDHEADDEMSPREPPQAQSCLNEINVRSSSSCVSSSIGVFTHSAPIKCLLTGILGCNPAMSRKICIEDSSVTVLQHSWKMGWQIKRLNDTAHLRLL
ncbi:uncharacterized protein LOC130775200 isoform X2 [Actinidia eriantha]|uniref:uncharacterized protein LOC130775200 isoform X2 n=1 Tax=Actinidia eriantha TaxID=165200 RepID=UPI002583B757|nr:uncharacterized protein LOC130775200 isoform X2 [Actinidia eriantha]